MISRCHCFWGFQICGLTKLMCSRRLIVLMHEQSDALLNFKCGITGMHLVVSFQERLVTSLIPRFAHGLRDHQLKGWLIWRKNLKVRTISINPSVPCWIVCCHWVLSLHCVRVAYLLPSSVVALFDCCHVLICVLPLDAKWLSVKF